MEPKVVAKKSIKLELEPGLYEWCACGMSSSQPFCDYTHEGTTFSPVEFEVKEKGIVSLCQCKHTKKPPYCDNTHRELP